MKCTETKKRYMQILILLLIGAAFYLFSGQAWVTIEDDSPIYLDEEIKNAGVMPIYPLFLSVMKYFFGEILYLDAAVVIQSVIAILFTMIFVLYLQYVFRLKFIETILFYIGTMMPFAFELPRVCITHQIMTESLAFSFFYIFFMFLMQYVLSGKRKWLAATVGMAVVMALTRSQLLFLFIVTVIFFVGAEFARDKKSGGIKRWIKAGRNFLLGMVVTYLLVLLVYQLRGNYFTFVHPALNSRNQKAEVVEQESEEQEIEEETTEAEIVKYQARMSQMTHLIIIRGFYEADEEDAALFDTPEMQEIFRRVYDEIDKDQYRYEYAEPGLYMWRDLVKDEIAWVAGGAVSNYLSEHPEIQMNAEEAMKELGMKILLKHFDRYLYHSIRLMIVGFISSVFFQIEKIYLLCHFITLFLFGFSIWGILYCIKYKGEKNVIIFAGITVGFICLLVGVFALVFIPLQRYMVYAMGIYYCSMYLLLKEVLFIMAERNELPWIKKILKF